MPQSPVPKYKSRWTTKDSPFPPEGGGLYIPYAFFDLLPKLIREDQMDYGDALVFLHLMRYKWEEETIVFPKLGTIAANMGTSRRTVRRSISRMEQNGLLKRHERNGKPSSIDLEPLLRLVGLQAGEKKTKLST